MHTFTPKGTPCWTILKDNIVLIKGKSEKKLRNLRDNRNWTLTPVISFTFSPMLHNKAFIFRWSLNFLWFLFIYLEGLITFGQSMCTYLYVEISFEQSLTSLQITNRIQLFFFLFNYQSLLTAHSFLPRKIKGTVLVLHSSNLDPRKSFFFLGWRE